jgi:hypothetical protein
MLPRRTTSDGMLICLVLGFSRRRASETRFPLQLGHCKSNLHIVYHALGGAIRWLPDSPSSVSSSAASTVRKTVKNHDTARKSTIGTSREEPC